MNPPGQSITEALHTTTLLIYIYMSQAQKRVQKRDDKIWNFHDKWLFGVDAGGYADKLWQFFCACTVVFLPKW